jgi:hypothetical protein
LYEIHSSSIKQTYKYENDYINFNIYTLYSMGINSFSLLNLKIQIMNNINKFIEAKQTDGFCEILEYPTAYIISYTGFSNNLIRMGIVMKDNPYVVVMEPLPRMHNTFRVNCGAELCQYFTIDTTTDFNPYSFMGEYNILLEASALAEDKDEE